MKTLKTLLNESLNSQKINEVITIPADYKKFWKWVDAVEKIAGNDLASIINDSYSDKKNYNDFYEILYNMKLKVRDFNEYCDAFSSIANDILDYDCDEGGSDDDCQYASWEIPFKGEKDYKYCVKNEVNDGEAYFGEHCGYAMDPESYKEFIDTCKNGVEP